MKKNFYYKFKNSSKILLGSALVLTVLFSSCKKDDTNKNGSFKLKDNPTELLAPAKGISQTFTIISNGDWEIKPLMDEDWISVEPMQGTGDATFTLNVNENTTVNDRMLRLTFIVNGQRVTTWLKIEQEGGDSEVGVVVFSEDFDWLTHGSGIFYETTGEHRMDNWSAEEMEKGWTSTINPVQGSGNQPLVYARQGFVKLGKTNYGGDLISPKLAAVTGTKNLEVKFKAVPYQTEAGTRDGTILKVNVIGPGTVSQDEFTIDNWPDYEADPDATGIWKEDEAERTFNITGATAETQIRFLGQAFDLRAPVSPNKNRIFLDDIIVTIADDDISQ